MVPAAPRSPPPARGGGDPATLLRAGGRLGLRLGRRHRPADNSGPGRASIAAAGPRRRRPGGRLGLRLGRRHRPAAAGRRTPAAPRSGRRHRPGAGPCRGFSLWAWRIKMLSVTAAPLGKQPLLGGSVGGVGSRFVGETGFSYRIRTH